MFVCVRFMYVYESIVSGGTLSIDFWIVLQATPFLPRSNDWMEDVLQLAARGIVGSSAEPD